MFRTIVVGAAGSGTAALAVETAAGLAERFGATLHLVSVLSPPALLAVAPEAAALAAATVWVEEARVDQEAGLRDAATRLGERGIEVRRHVGAGDPAAIICQVAERENADLIVVGNRGMKGARRVLGSVPNTVSHQAACDVLIVRTS